MMRNILSILLIIVFFAGSFKMTLATHYCGGKIAKVKFGFGKVIATCGMEEGNASCEGEYLGVNCCKDKIQQALLSDFLSQTTNSIIGITDFFVLNYYKITCLFSSESLTGFFLNYKPPQGCFNAVYLPFIKVFRI